MKNFQKPNESALLGQQTRECLKGLEEAEDIV